MMPHLLVLAAYVCLPLLELGGGTPSNGMDIPPPYDTMEKMSNGSQHDGSRSEHFNEALEEQGYYLLRLFVQYGENGTLSYDGLQKLLGSLGLGEVSVLEISHRRPKQNTPTSAHPPSHQGADAPNPPPSSADTVRLPGGSAPTEGLVSDGVKDDPLPQSPANPVSKLKNGLLESMLSNHPTQTHLHGNCLNVSQLLGNFGLGKASHITPAHFTFLCPALLYQIESGVCLRHTDADGAHTDSSVTFLKALGWSSLALALISLPSLLALSLVPLVPPARLRTLLCPMAAMAVGTLCGDALLHLLPHASAEPHSEDHDSVWKGLSVLGGFYLLFIMESLLGMRNQYKVRSSKRKQEATASLDPEMELIAVQNPSAPEQRQPSEQRHHGHSHGPADHEHAGIGSLVWMVVMGDGIHNFTDGLAIGTAFSQSLTGGLSTTIAVFCHELPHELGDLAVLLGAGWPVRRLVIFSAASALLGFAGLLTGAVLGQHASQLSPWILTLTAGVFLYVALADMTPEMLRGDPGPMSPLTRFLLQNLGLLTGGAVMLCIALFEDHIAFNLGES